MFDLFIRYFSFIVLLFSTFLSGQEKGQSLAIEIEPVFQVDRPAPTQDKPQSKLWYAHGDWWVLLPDREGPSVWKRSQKVWKKDLELATDLSGLPGKADIYGNDGDVMAILVGDCELEAIRLAYDGSSYHLQYRTRLSVPGTCSSVETATIARDGNGIWWVASDMDNGVMVWASEDGGRTWSLPIEMADGIDGDDISVISKLKGEVSVIWSNQEDESIRERTHRDGDALENWSPIQTIDKGGKTADDHLNTTLLSDGTLVLVSKNSLDELNEPQFVLRVRDGLGNWTNIPYATLTNERHPTRPVVTHLPNGECVALHTVGVPNDRPYISVVHISWDGSSVVVEEKIQVRAKDGSGINNVTVGKLDFLDAPSGPWITLFSDGQGRVYELDLYDYRQLFETGHP